MTDEVIGPIPGPDDPGVVVPQVIEAAQPPLPSPPVVDAAPSTWEAAFKEALAELQSLPTEPLTDPLQAKFILLGAVRDQLTYESVVVRTLQLMGGLADGAQVQPRMALDRITQGMMNIDSTTRQLHQALDEQAGTLSQLAVLAELKNGDLFSKMHDIFAAWKPPAPAAT